MRIEAISGSEMLSTMSTSGAEAWEGASRGRPPQQTAKGRGGRGQSRPVSWPCASRIGVPRSHDRHAMATACGEPTVRSTPAATSPSTDARPPRALPRAWKMRKTSFKTFRGLLRTPARHTSCRRFMKTTPPARIGRDHSSAGRKASKAVLTTTALLFLQMPLRHSTSTARRNSSWLKEV